MTSPSAFRVALAGGLVGVLLLGFLSSVLADRLVFLGWALATAALYAWILHRCHGGPRRLAGPLAVLAVGAVTYAGLAVRYGEELILGMAAALPPTPLGAS